MTGQSLRAPRPGTALKRTGAALIAAGMIFSIVINATSGNIAPLFMSDISDIWMLTALSSFVSLVMVPGGAFLIWRARQYAAQASAKRIITDSKPHLLYLRAFRSDPSTVKIFWNTLDHRNLLFGLESEEFKIRCLTTTRSSPRSP